MTQMVRKQIYIHKRQKAKVRQAAKARGMSEAEFIRQAIDQQLAGGSKTLPADPATWERALKLMQDLYALGPLPAEPRWTREELYEDENGNLRGTPRH
ncbi:MAG: ribbon-helix-helix protein, CopG family [Anaerolineales bacterium]|nr:ribbon-helix-helix protein, CopG family [Anaerolineales bacterium]